MTDERIVAAAIRLSDGQVLWLPPPARHHTVLHQAVEFGYDIKRNHQGFVTDDGHYVGRFTACTIATAAGQLIRKTGPADMLFSEDVW